MADSNIPTRPALGDPIPWFSAKTVSGSRIDIHVDAGRYLVLTFIGKPGDGNGDTDPKLGELMFQPSLFREDHIILYGVLEAAPADRSRYKLIRRPGISFLADYDGALAQQFGVRDRPWTFVLDPMLRVIASIPYDHPEGHGKLLRETLQGLPPPAQHAGVPLKAPVLIVPRVLEFDLCDAMVEYHRRSEGTDSGFLLDKDGVTRTITDYTFKRRTDVVVRDLELVTLLRQRIVSRVLPAMKQAFSFEPTRMDRYLIASYHANTGDHFFRHRDNLNAGAAHRRFAMTLNLNAEAKNYDGGDLRFPEFGTDTYRPPTGGAVIFSCGLLHEVTPMTRGERFAFLSFLYGEEDAKRRAANNAKLSEGERVYQDGDDLLMPRDTTAA
ncbi:MAG TPA: 2OG-Fe(II) oxygenase [Magnetospirillaceae bacterium]|jgi:predicted 2-oxoglutarate/Fe(II)-dependent dioxygenase YbiX